MKAHIKNIFHTPNEKETSINSSPKLFKPLPINQRLLRKTENNMSFPLSTIQNDSNIPLVYPQFQYGSLCNLNMNCSPQLHHFMYQEKNKNKKIIDPKTKTCCSCIKTKCIKKYCECFANNKLCTNCICLDCRNKDIYMTSEKKENNGNNNKELIFCTCSKSGCNKKYCECYKEGSKCNIKCRCINCLNTDEHSEKKNVNDQIINLDETRCDSGKKSICSETNEFNIQKISILISQSQTYIDIEKLSKEDFGLLCKKRKIDKC